MSGGWKQLLNYNNILISIGQGCQIEYCTTPNRREKHKEGIITKIYHITIFNIFHFLLCGEGVKGHIKGHFYTQKIRGPLFDWVPKKTFFLLLKVLYSKIGVFESKITMKFGFPTLTF